MENEKKTKEKWGRKKEKMEGKGGGEEGYSTISLA